MAAPLNLECPLDIARQWPRLRAAAGVSVHIGPDSLSGTAEDHGRPTRVKFLQYNVDLVSDYDDDEVVSRLREEKAGLCCCHLDDIHEPVASILAKSLLASGARCSYEPLGLLETAALVAFDKATGLTDWVRALSGAAGLHVEGALYHPGGPELPFGRVSGDLASVRFATGPACLGADVPLHTYLELQLERVRDWQTQPVQNFIEDVVARLGSCAGAAIVLWGELLRHAR